MLRLLSKMEEGNHEKMWAFSRIWKRQGNLF